MVEFHFYASPDFMFKKNDYIKYELYESGWNETAERIEKIKNALKKFGNEIKPQLHTLQMSFLRDVWDLHFEYGAKIFVHDETGDYEISESNGCTDRQLRRAHDIFKLWRSGAFAHRTDKKEESFGIVLSDNEFEKAKEEWNELMDKVLE